MLKPGGVMVVATWCQRDDAPPAAAFSAAELKRLDYLYAEWTHPHFISIEEYGRLMAGTGVLEHIHTEDWWARTIAAWRHSIWVRCADNRLRPPRGEGVCVHLRVPVTPQGHTRLESPPLPDSLLVPPISLRSASTILGPSCAGPGSGTPPPHRPPPRLVPPPPSCDLSGIAPWTQLRGHSSVGTAAGRRRRHPMHPLHECVLLVGFACGAHRYKTLRDGICLDRFHRAFEVRPPPPHSRSPKKPKRCSLSLRWLWK